MSWNLFECGGLNVGALEFLYLEKINRPVKQILGICSYVPGPGILRDKESTINYVQYT